MVMNEERVVLMGIFMALILVIANGAYLLYQSEDFGSTISGNSIRETVEGFYTGSSIGHRIFILSQFLLLFAIIIVVLIIVRRLKSKANLSKKNYIGKGNIKSKTDLDTLYEILKRENEISIEDIGKVFNVNLDVALEWSKVLENGDLAMIDYPRFGKPVLRLAEKDSIKKIGLIGEIKGKDVAKKFTNEKAKVSGEKVPPEKKQIPKETIGKNIVTKKTNISKDVPEKISGRTNEKIPRKIKKITKKIEKKRKKILKYSK